MNLPVMPTTLPHNYLTKSLFKCQVAGREGLAPPHKQFQKLLPYYLATAQQKIMEPHLCAAQRFLAYKARVIAVILVRHGVQKRLLT